LGLAVGRHLQVHLQSTYWLLAAEVVALPDMQVVVVPVD
jgi:hypothetical protein